jgi:hypothetical protein
VRGRQEARRNAAPAPTPRRAWTGLGGWMKAVCCCGALVANAQQASEEKRSIGNGESAGTNGGAINRTRTKEAPCGQASQSGIIQKGGEVTCHESCCPGPHRSPSAYHSERRHWMATALNDSAYSSAACSCCEMGLSCSGSRRETPNLQAWAAILRRCRIHVFLSSSCSARQPTGSRSRARS